MGLEKKVKDMLVLYVDHQVRMSKTNGEIIEGEMKKIDADGNTVTVFVNGEAQVVSLEELCDVRYMGILTDYKTRAQAGVIDDALPFDMAPYKGAAWYEKIRYQEFECRVSCHLEVDMQIKAYEVELEDFSHVLNKELLESGNYLYTFSDGSCCAGTLRYGEEICELFYKDSKVREFSWKEVVDITRQPVLGNTVTICLKDGQRYTGMVTAAQQNFCNLLHSQNQLANIPFSEIGQIYYHGKVTERAMRKPGVIDGTYYCKYPYYLQNEEEEEKFRFGAEVIYAVGVNRRGLIAKRVHFDKREKENVAAETKLGIVLTLKKDFGFIGNEYVMPSCGMAVKGEVMFDPNAAPYMSVKDNIYIVKYTLTGEMSKQGQQMAEVIEISEAIPKRYVGIVRIVENQIERIPLFQAVVNGEKTGDVYKQKEVEITCKDGTISAGVVKEHNADGFLLEGGGLIAYSVIENVRIFETVTSYGSNGVGYTASGLWFHIGDNALDEDSLMKLREGVRISFALANNLNGSRNDRNEQWKYFNIVDMAVIEEEKEEPISSTEDVADTPAPWKLEQIPELSVAEDGISLKQSFGEIPSGTEGGYGIFMHRKGTQFLYINPTYVSKAIKTEGTLQKGISIQETEAEILPEEPSDTAYFWIVRYTKEIGKPLRAGSYRIEVVGKIKKEPSLETIKIAEGDFLSVQRSNKESDKIPEVVAGETVFYGYERKTDKGENNYYGFSKEEIIEAANRNDIAVKEQEITTWRFAVLTDWDKEIKKGYLNNSKTVSFDWKVAEQRTFNIFKTASQKMLISYTCSDGKIVRVRLIPDEVINLLSWKEGMVSGKRENAVSVSVEKARILHYLTVRSDGLVSRNASDGKISGEKVYVRTVCCPDWGRKEGIVGVAADIHMKEELATIQYHNARNCYMAYRDQTHFVPLENADSRELQEKANEKVQISFVPEEGGRLLTAYLKRAAADTQISKEADCKSRVERFAKDFEDAKNKTAETGNLYKEVFEKCVGNRSKDSLKALCYNDDTLYRALEMIQVICEMLKDKRCAEFAESELALLEAERNLILAETDLINAEKTLSGRGESVELIGIIRQILNQMKASVEADFNLLYKNSTPDITCTPYKTEVTKGQDTLYVIVSNKENRQSTNVEVTVQVDLPEGTLEKTAFAIKSLKGGARGVACFKMNLSEFAGNKITIYWQADYHYANGYTEGRKNLQDSVKKGEFSLLIQDGERMQAIKEKAKNPYEIPAQGAPLAGNDKMFFGRIEQLRTIWDYMLNQDGKIEPGKKVIIYGQKRTGKSSLVNQIMSSMQNGKIEEAVSEKMKTAWAEEAKPLVIYIKNMGAIDGESKEDYLINLYWSILSQIKEAMMTDPDLRSAMAAEGLCVPDLGSVNDWNSIPATFDNFIQELRRLDSGKHKLVLIMDEYTSVCVKADRYTKQGKEEWTRLPEEIMEKFSGLGFTQIIIGHSFMVSSFKELGIINKTMEGGALNQEISALNEEEAKSLICKPMKEALENNCPYEGELGEQVIEKLLDLSGRTPYILMNLCSRMFSYYINSPNVSLTLNDVTSMLEIWMKENDTNKRLNENLFDPMTLENETGMPNQKPSWKFLKEAALLAAQNPNRDCSENFEMKGITPETVEELKSKLENQNVISVEGGRLQIKVGLFGEYVKYKNKEEKEYGD